MSDHEATEPLPDDRDSASTADRPADEQSKRPGDGEGGREDALTPVTEPK